MSAPTDPRVEVLVAEAIDGGGAPKADGLTDAESRRAADLQLMHALLVQASAPKTMAEERSARLDVLMSRIRRETAPSVDVVARIGWRRRLVHNVPQLAAAACLLATLSVMLVFSVSEPAVAYEDFDRAISTAAEPTDRQYELRFVKRNPETGIDLVHTSLLEVRGEDNFLYQGRFGRNDLMIMGSEGLVTRVENGRIMPAMTDRAAARRWVGLHHMPMPFFTIRSALSEVTEAFDVSLIGEVADHPELDELVGRRRSPTVRLEPEHVRVWIDRERAVIHRLRMTWSARQLAFIRRHRNRQFPESNGSTERAQVIRQIRAMGEPVYFEVRLVSEQARPDDWYTVEGQQNERRAHPTTLPRSTGGG